MPAKHEAREAESAQAQTLLTMSWSIFKNALTYRGGAQGRVISDARTRAAKRLERDDFSSNRHPALGYCWSMIFSENRYPLFGIML